MLRSLLAVCTLLRSSLAVFADEAWNIDYHHALLGEPKDSTTFFHRPNPESRASLIYTLSEKGVLGAVNPRDGDVVWRQLLDAGSKVTAANTSFLRAGDGQDVVVSGLGRQVAAWSAGDGRLVWSHDVAGELQDVEIIELPDARSTGGAKDALIMVGGGHAAVQRLDGATGAVKWEHKLESGDTPYQVSASATEVFAILLHKTMLGYIKIKVISLDPVTGRKADEHALSSESELATADTIISVGANSASPIIAWTDSAYTTLKVNIVGTKPVATFSIEKHGQEAVERVVLHAPYHTNSLAHFMIHYQAAGSDWADVFHVNVKKSSIDKAYSLPKMSGRSAFSVSTNDANVYFTRVTNDQVLTMSSASHGVLAKWNSNILSKVGDAEQTKLVHATSEVSIKGDAVSAVRTGILLSTGQWVLLRDGSKVWQRPEVLAGTVSAAFALSAEADILANNLEAEAHSNFVQAYIHRVTRHVKDLQRLPAILKALPQNFVQGFLGTGSDGSDVFGFNRIIVSATEKGRLVALDAGDPSNILWTKQAVQLAPGETWSPHLETLPNGRIRVNGPADESADVYNASSGARTTSPPNTEPDHTSVDVAVRFTIKGGRLEATTTQQQSKNALAWHFTPQQGERILELVPRPLNDPVASIGKVLGDRTVLYKYLNPNLALLTTAHDVTRSVTVYVLDTVSGTIIHSTTHPIVDLNAPIASTLSENWFSYSYTAESTDTSPKGHQLVVGEIFESLAANDRGPLDAATNVSSLSGNTRPFTMTQTYHIPESISKMSVTQTGQGITSRQLLAVLAESSSIVGIPRNVIDPRRPVDRDPTKNEQAEGLVRYSPVVEFDPKWYLNHKREVLGIKDVTTSPALLESTSLIFAYGLDVFGTRLSPSFNFDMLGKDFNKFQMLATVAALAVATFVVAPLVGIVSRFGLP
jgi:hypothetical protein